MSEDGEEGKYMVLFEEKKWAKRLKWRTNTSTAINIQQGSANYSPGQINLSVIYIKFY